MLRKPNSQQYGTFCKILNKTQKHDLKKLKNLQNFTKNNKKNVFQKFHN